MFVFSFFTCLLNRGEGNQEKPAADHCCTQGVISMKETFLLLTTFYLFSGRKEGSTQEPQQWPKSIRFRLKFNKLYHNYPSLT